jgi:hypothetical protein
MIVNTNPAPVKDGDVLQYSPPQSPPKGGNVKFYYVNGIRTSPEAHRDIATLIAGVVETTVTGVYNQSDGFVGDLSQCLGDWIGIVRGQVGEQGFWRDRLTQSAIDKLASFNIHAAWGKDYLHAMRDAFVAPSEIAPRHTDLADIRKSLKRNEASLSLFDELSKDLHQPQIVVAHSQGNLITSFTLWAMQAVYGSKGLERIQVRSVSSPSPAWPRGINHRIKVYGQKDDFVTLCDPKNWTGNRSAGYWDNFFPKHPGKFVKSGGIAAHDVEYNILDTSLARRLRADAGLATF